jgi:lysophospholipase L1-like esterase
MKSLFVINKKVMKPFFVIIFLMNYAWAQVETIQKDSNIKYINKNFLLVEGTPFTDLEKENTFDRLPLRYKNKVSEEVWALSKNSSGLSVRFMTNSTLIKVKWELTTYAGSMPHMAATGSMGVDLYYKQGTQWQFVNTGIPKSKKNEAMLVESMNAEWREFRMFLPLYSGITNLEIGIDSASEIQLPARDDKKPIVFYGTSITQGACASRPGMAYTNIISRKLNADCINFGFSGNGTMDTEMAQVFSEIDASYYIIDCVVNMTPEQIMQNTLPFIEILRSAHPETPIVLIEGTLPQDAALNQQKKFILSVKNPALKNEYEKMMEAGIKNVYYVTRENLIGNDHEATVDGTHFTDLGFMRFADALTNELKKIK